MAASLDLTSFSTEDLRQVIARATTLVEGRSYFEIEDPDEAPFELPDNFPAIIARIQVVDYQEDEGAWFCHEDGRAWKATLQIEGLQPLVYLTKNQHQSKHTFTETRTIKIEKEEYVYSSGDHARDENYNVHVLRTLHQVLGIPKDQTAQMVHLLFLKDSWFPYIEDRICPLAEEDSEEEDAEESPPDKVVTDSPDKD